jgi:hypothetical protein
VGDGLEEADDFPVDDFELVEVEGGDELLLEVGDDQFSELREQLVLQRAENVHHVLLVLVEPLPRLLVAEEDERQDLRLLDQSLDYVAVFVDDALGVRLLHPQVVEPPKHLDEEGGHRFKPFHAALNLHFLDYQVDPFLDELQHFKFLYEVDLPHLLLPLFPLLLGNFIVEEACPRAVH